MKTYNINNANTPSADDAVMEEPFLTESGELESMAMNNLFANNDYHIMQDKIHRLESELAAARSERDEAHRMLDEAETKIEEYEKTKAEDKIVDHDQLVSEIFTEIALRYMESTKEKTVEQRTKVKESLRDISFELKMNLSRETQKCINKFDNANPPVVPQITVHNEYVMEKNVTTEIGKVESGATGAIIKQSKPKNR